MFSAAGVREFHAQIGLQRRAYFTQYLERSLHAEYLDSKKGANLLEKPFYLQRTLG